MADIDWPAGLPQRFERQGYKDSPADNRVVTETDIGPPKKRRRSTIGIKTMSGTMKMTAAQLEDLEEFYYETVQETLPFNFPHPRLDGDAVVTFKDWDIVGETGPDTWRVALSFEQQDFIPNP